MHKYIANDHQLMTFLEQAANHIFQRHGHRMDHVWVILPTRRAVSFFRQHLSQHASTPFLSPHVMAVDDFITQSAGVQLIDSVGLLFELYDVFKGIDDTLDFGRFLNWATVLLTDFDRIDQYLISPSELFSYLTAAKALERWKLDLPDGRTANLETLTTQRYFKLFENLDSSDLRINVPAVSAADLIRPSAGAETSASVAVRVARAREIQQARFAALGQSSTTTNAHCAASIVDTIAALDARGTSLLRDASEKLQFSARAYHRVLRVARTLADLEGSDAVNRIHLAEAISYRMPGEGQMRAAA